MEAVKPVMEEQIAETHDHTHVVKGKRTKRSRLQLPVMASSSSLSGEDQNTTSANSSNNLISPTTSAESSCGAVTEEEEDMAICLILLAQGSCRGTSKPEGEKFFLGQRLAEAATTTTAMTTNGKVGQYAYECKTCNRCFPSFQALGGHRASHKKPKLAAGGVEESPINCLTLQVGKSVPYSNTGSNKSRVHECSICGSEFSSGQALGGHMRRHKAAMAESSLPESKKQKSVLSLDLNLPAPAEDERDFASSPRSFAFAGKQALVFSSTPLVDCHY